LICPRCNDSQLVERRLDGLAIDVCSRCQGIWLDRGELEQLRNRELERFRHEDDDEDDDDDDRRRRQAPPLDRDGHGRAPYGPTPYDREYVERRPLPPKQSKWRGLFELFD
jgi:Zn-finger nucleic acid-binding protein